MQRFSSTTKALFRLRRGNVMCVFPSSRMSHCILHPPAPPARLYVPDTSCKISCIYEASKSSMQLQKYSAELIIHVGFFVDASRKEVQSLWINIPETTIINNDCPWLEYYNLPQLASFTRVVLFSIEHCTTRSMPERSTYRASAQ